MSAADTLLAGLREKAGDDFVAQRRTTPWCFGRLQGERQMLMLEFGQEEAAARILKDLCDYDFALSDLLVADITAVRLPWLDGKLRVSVEALTFATD